MDLIDVIKKRIYLAKQVALFTDLKKAAANNDCNRVQELGSQILEREMRDALQMIRQAPVPVNEARFWAKKRLTDYFPITDTKKKIRVVTDPLDDEELEVLQDVITFYAGEMRHGMFAFYVRALSAPDSQACFAWIMGYEAEVVVLLRRIVMKHLKHAVSEEEALWKKTEFFVWKYNSLVALALHQNQRLWNSRLGNWVDTLKSILKCRLIKSEDDDREMAERIMAQETWD